MFSYIQINEIKKKQTLFDIEPAILSKVTPDGIQTFCVGNPEDK